MSIEEAKEIFMRVIWSHLSRPYRWGGDDPSGFDCSGLVIEGLKSVGMFKQNADATAGDLWRWFQADREQAPSEGCLVFWEGDNGGIRHIEVAINDALSIGAAGGGPKTLSSADAWRQNAYIKVRPIIGRGVIAGYADPWK